MKLSFDIPQLALGRTRSHLRLSPDEQQYVVEHGHIVRRDGHEFIVLREYDIPETDRRQKRYQRLVGIEAQICPTDGCLLSIHRHSRPHRRQPYRRHYRREPSYRWQYA